MNKNKIFVFLIILILVFPGCSIQNVKDNNEKITVAVSVVPCAAFVKEIAGELVNTVTVIPKGNSPANYQPTTMEMQALSDADIYFVMQVPAEEANILPKVNDFNNDIILVNLRDAVSAEYPLRHISDHHHDDDTQDEEDEYTIDPHIWLSPKRAITIVDTIAGELSKIDPEHESIYNKNAADYIERLKKLDNDIKEIVSGMENKSFMIYHGSYGYFAGDYGLEMISLEADGKAPTAARMQEVIDQANALNITTVFYQDEFDDSQAQTIAEEIGGRVEKSAPLSEEYIQSLLDFAKALVQNGENQ